MKKILFIIVVFVLSIQSIAFCQTDSTVLKNAVSKLQTFLKLHAVEKVYLHLDKPYYVAGEVVYFKAYVTYGERHELSTLSGVLHVDFINKNNLVLQSMILQLNNGLAAGDIPLSDTLQKGNYRIRAYTQVMRNNDSNYFFDKYISIGSINTIDNTAVVTKAPAVLQFFPEGGTLVNDIKSRLAFKAISGNGLGVRVKGVVLDNDKKEIVKFSSGHLGMGVFEITPEPGKTYTAKVTYGDGSQSTIDLPACEPKGIVLAINNDNPNKIAIEIRANRAYYKENLNKDLNLVIYSGGAVNTVKTKLDSEILGLDLSKNNYPTGILQVTLFSQTGEPLSERLAFIQNNDLLNLKVTTNKTLYAKRENVQLNLNVKNKAGNPVNGSFSVSVIDESKILVDENNENSITSHLLLTTDLKGYVEKPNYYFANPTDETRKDLDALMLTQGYGRFVWKQLLTGNSTPELAFKSEKGIDIAGILKTKAGVPVKTNITLLGQAGEFALSQETDEQGKFRFSDIAYESGTKFLLKVKPSEGKNAVLKLNGLASGSVIPIGNSIDAGFNANADVLALIQNNQKAGIVTASKGSRSLLLKNDDSKSVKRNDNYRSSNLGGPGHADQVIRGDDIKNASSLSTALNGLAHGVQFIGGVPKLQTGGVVSLNGQSVEPMLVIVDGANLGRGVNINSYNPSYVETVEILKGNNGAIYGIEGGQGVMVITTRLGSGRDEATGKEMSPGIFSIAPEGYYKAHEFYSPRYEVSQSANALPDQRVTIFWKSDIVTNAEGNAALNFFNADGTGNYRVLIEGIDSRGNLGRQVYRYKVN